jgi:AbiU2
MTALIIREIAAAAVTDAIEILGIIEVLEASNQKPVSQALNEAGAGRAAEHVKRALFTRLHFLVARAYGKTRPGDRHARKAFELLKDQNVAKEMHSAPDLTEAQQRWEKCCGDPRLKSFLHFRDKYLAHLGEPRPGVGLPTYGDIFAVARETTRALEKLAHASGVVGLSLDSQIPADKESARRFWAPWRKSKNAEALLTDTPEGKWLRARKII